MWQNRVSKCACKSNVPVWTNFPQASIKCSKWNAAVLVAMSNMSQFISEFCCCFLFVFVFCFLMLFPMKSRDRKMKPLHDFRQSAQIKKKMNWHWQNNLLVLGSGSLSSPMREHRNFAQFYCISVTNFSTVSECILLEIIWIKRTFSSHSYGCFCVCMQCSTSKNRQLIFYGRYLPFVRCRSRGPRHERKQSMCLSARWKSDTRCTQQYVVSLDRKLNADSCGVNAVVVYKHLWSLERILVGNSQKNLNFKPQNALKCLKYPPSNWSWIRTLWNEVWG